MSTPIHTVDAFTDRAFAGNPAGAAAAVGGRAGKSISISPSRRIASSIPLRV